MKKFRMEADRELVNQLSQATMALSAELERMMDKALQFAEAMRRSGKGKVLWPIEGELEKGISRAFAKQGNGYGRQFEAGNYAEFGTDGKLPDGWDVVDGETWRLFEGAIEEAAKKGLAAGARGLMAEVGAQVGFNLGNPRAVAYLKKHGAELVKGILETTREDMRVMLRWGMEQGWSYDKMAGAIQERFKGYSDGSSWWNFDAPRPQGHIDSRAHLIAVTEAGEAYEEGGYEAAGLLEAEGVGVEKMWSTMGDELVSEGCQENEAEGWIGYDEVHKSGDLHPLRFPGCRCDEVYRREGG